jgi:hypothetical protein
MIIKVSRQTKSTSLEARKAVDEVKLSIWTAHPALEACKNQTINAYMATIIVS